MSRSRVRSALCLLISLTLLLTAPGCTLSLLDLPDLFGGGTPAPVVNLPTATPMPVAQITFQVSLPGPLPAGVGLAITLLDEVTGLPFNAVSYPMQALDATTYGVTLPLPIHTVIRYRYNQIGAGQAHEDSGLDLPVRYRMLQVTNSGTVTDVIASWSNQPFAGDHGSLTGRVLDADTGAPLPDLLICFGGQQTLTDSTGSFALTYLPVGTYNLVISSLDGSYQLFQQGARIGKDQVTPVEVRLRRADMVSVTFVVTPPTNTVEGAPLRLAGNLWQLGNSFADLRGGMSGVVERMPVLTRQSDGRYSLTLSLPVGADIQYKYTLGDGFWNAEHHSDGTFRLRHLIVPAGNVVVEDMISSWQSGPGAGPILFEVTVPAETPDEELVYIQFNPYDWTEPLPMWPMGNDRWAFRLYGPLTMMRSFTYRYCRNGQCNTADDQATPGASARGREATTSVMPQNFQDTVSRWTRLQAFPPTTLTGASIAGRVGFVGGVEFAPGYAPGQSAFLPGAFANVQGLGANWVVLTPTWTAANPPRAAFDPRPGSDPLWTETALHVGQARALGLNVALFPALNFPVAAEDWWRAAPRDAAWWRTWFEQYRRFAVHYADLATRHGAPALILGGEWVLPALPGGRLPDGQPSLVPAEAEALWRALIAEVRAHYAGMVWWAWPYSPGGFASAPAFLRETDGLYVLLAPTPGAGRDAVRDQVGRILDEELLPFAAALQKPVLLAFAIPAPEVSAAGLQAQMDAYEGALLAVNQREWISGFVSRGYSPAVILHGGNSVRSTPAADLLWYWLAAFRGMPR